jgi:hypothetical protein
MAKKPKRKAARKLPRKIVRKTVRKSKKIAKPVALPPRVVPEDSSRTGDIAIPADLAYQWIRVELFGELDHQSHGAALDAGWRPVPFKRHAGQFHPNNDWPGKIVHGGRMLMENAADAASAQIDALMSKAHQQMTEAWEPFGGQPNGRKHTFAIMPGDFVVSEKYARIASDALPIDVEVTIRVRLPASVQDTIQALHLPMEEYARRRLVMEPGVLYPVNGEKDEPPTFEFWNFPFILSKSETK